MNFTAPIGRLVWGDPFTAQTLTDDVTKLPKRDAAGNIMIEYTIGVAYSKTDPLWPAFREMLKVEDRRAWPQFHGPNGEVLPGVKFADKITDGDGFNTKGQPHSAKDGYAGHWIVKYGTQYAPTVHYYDDATRSWVQMVDKSQLKAGDYIKVSGSTQTNNSSQSPGMYRNFNMVALYGRGVAIVKGPDANAAFDAPPPGSAAPNMVTAPPPGAGPAPQPPGAPPPAPVMSAPLMLASANGVPYEAWRAQGWTDEQLITAGHMAQPVVMAPAAPPPAPPAPPAAPPAPPPTPPAPPPAPGRVMLPAANGQTYEAMLAAGWTDALLVQHGMMAA